MMHIAAHGRNTEQALSLVEALAQLSNWFYSSKELGPASVCTTTPLNDAQLHPLQAHC